MKAHLSGGYQFSLQWLAWGLLLWSAGFALSLTSPYITGDEGWFLQVASRLSNGEVLYREVFYGVTPLAAYLAALAVKIFGPELAVIKAQQALYFCLLGLLSARLGLRLGLGHRFRVSLTLAMLVFANPWVMGSGTHYSPLAYLFQLAAILALLDHRLGLAGILAGLSFAAKQTVGAYTLVGLSLAWLVYQPQQSRQALWKAASRLAGGFSIAVAVFVLWPVTASGSWPAFLDFGFLNKTTYLSVATVSYPKMVSSLVRMFLSVASWERVFQNLLQSQLLLPPVVLLLGIYSLTRSRSRQARMILILILSATLDFFLLANLHHVSCALPLLWTLGAAALNPLRTLNLPRQLSEAIPLPVRAAFQAGLVLLGVFFAAAPPARLIFRQGYLPAQARHIRGVFLPPGLETRLIDSANRLQKIVAGQPTFLLMPNAALFYLLSDLPNPTPYDYPLLTAFGRQGITRVSQALEEGQLKAACVTLPSQYPLAVHSLEEKIQSVMTPVADLGFCQLFRWPTPGLSAP
jgi:hypothetical protein